jgi:phospholipid transport system transporter-binding protein
VILGFSSITNANAPAVVAAGTTAIHSGDAVIDLSGVQHCDTSAVACVLEWLRQARAADRKLELHSVPAAVRSLAKLYGLESILEGALG